MGTTRLVFLLGSKAYKFPRPTKWRLFLHGLLANMQEVQWSGVSKLLSPVRFHLPGGFLVVMDKCLPVSDWDPDLLHNYDFELDIYLPVESKPDSWGLHPNLGVVAIDYGS